MFKKQRLSRKLLVFSLLLAAIVLPLMFLGCSDDDDNDNETSYNWLTSPYLICAARNPGGVVFDFVLNGEKGGAVNLDEYPDFDWDLLVKVFKCENIEGEVKGFPFADLHGDVDVLDAALGIDASSLDDIGTGNEGYNAVTYVSSDILNGLAADEAGFDPDSVPAGETGYPLYSGPDGMKAQYDKLVIGEKWKATAKTGDLSGPSGDEKVWVIETKEGRHVKLMFEAFPANGEKGYVAIKWDLID